MTPKLDKWLFVVPCRLASVRLPEKPLQDLGGLPLILRMYQKVAPLRELGGDLIFAIDDPKVEEVCQKNKIPYLMTPPELQSGTDRVHFAAKVYSEKLEESFKKRWVMNIQGDEPFVSVDDIARLAFEMQNKQTATMGTLIYRSSDFEKFRNPNVVKVVKTSDDHALYFSRSPIPFDRSGDQLKSFWQHLGIYAFNDQSLEKFCTLPASELEQTEKLEQLRAVQAGWRILTVVAGTESWGIDTPEDLVKARSQIKS